MALNDNLLEVCQLEEMKKSTQVTENVFQSVHKVLEIMSKDRFTVADLENEKGGIQTQMLF